MDETTTRTAPEPGGEPTPERPMFSIVTAVYNVARYLPDFIASIEAQTFDLSRLQVVAVDDGSTDGSRELLEQWATRADHEVVVLSQQNAGQAAARNRGLEHATGEWISFIDPDDTVNAVFFQTMARFAAEEPKVQFMSGNVVLQEERTGRLSKHPRWRMYVNGDRLIDLDVSTAYIPGSSTTSAMRRDVIGDLRFNPGLRPNFEDGDFALRYLMRAPNRRVGFLRSAEYYYRKRSDQSSTLQTGISSVGRYAVVPREGYLAVLRDAQQQSGTIPMWIQHTILYDLSWYFSSEDAMANSASAIEGELGQTFRETLREIAAMLTPDIVDSFTIRKLKPHWCDILLHGLDGRSWHTPYAVVDLHDATRRLVRVSYRYTGEAPTEQVKSRGVVVEPQYAKVRNLDFFGATLMRERIVWVSSRGTVEIVVDGRRLELLPEWQGTRTRALGPKAINAMFSAQRKRRGISSTKADPIRLLAARGPARARFKGAWVLMDRIHDANDSGEILFRHLRAERPDINAWFVLEKDTPDWKRLKADGYGDRMVAHGSLMWKLLMLNCAHLISSHIDAPIQKPPAILKHGIPRWKFTFLQHGVIKDDLSNWLNAKQMDVFVTSTPGEYLSIAGDDTPYVFTTKEVALTGLPRFDRLHEKAKQFHGEGCDLILVAPTWRNWLVPPLKPGSQRRVVDESFFGTDYAKQWTEFLQSEQLQELAARTGRKVAFLPHPNIQPVLGKMDLPDSVVRLSFDGEDVQEFFARAAVLVTDYSSMAFNAAYMDRPVVYFQFDAERVNAGGHVGRAGYFHYDRDGFGPVVAQVRDAVAAVQDIADNGFDARPEYQQRIDETFPQRDGACCARVTAAIEQLDQKPSPGDKTKPVRAVEVAARASRSKDSKDSKDPKGSKGSKASTVAL